jgi:hypothetical protein
MKADMGATLEKEDNYFAGLGPGSPAKSDRRGADGSGSYRQQSSGVRKERRARCSKSSGQRSKIQEDSGNGESIAVNGRRIAVKISALQ